MLELKQHDDPPRVISDHAKNLNNGRIALTEWRAPAIVLSSVSQMDAGYSFVVSFEKAEAILVGSRKMTNIQRGLEIRRKFETLYYDNLSDPDAFNTEGSF
jgi:hypothetical protein